MIRSAACSTFELHDPESHAALPLLVLYPSDSPEQSHQIGPYTFNVAPDAPIAPGTFPLILISHGTGGSHLLYRGLAEHLARNGFIAAMPEHPFNNRNNNTLANTAANLANRPRHLRIVLEWAFSDSPLAGSLQADSVAIVGHSLGGYTALALAGGKPTAFPHESPDGQPRPIAVTPDARVKALVLLAPATAWYMAPDALSNVNVPILMLTAEKDPHTPSWHAGLIERGIPNPALLEHRVVPNAGHFSFLSPFPALMTSPSFAPSQDPAGFDRVRFHEEMKEEILAFLRRRLSNSTTTSSR